MANKVKFPWSRKGKEYFDNCKELFSSEGIQKQKDEIHNSVTFSEIRACVRACECVCGGGGCT